MVDKRRLLGCLCILSGCTGEITTGRGMDSPELEAPLLDHAEVTPLRRLNRDELSHTLRDLLGLTTNEGDGFPEDAEGPAGFYFPGVMSTLETSYLLETSEQISKSLAAKMPTLVGCDPATGEAACARSFIEKFGSRAYRRPLETEEVDELLAFFSSARMGLKYPFYDAARLVVQVMLQSPHFLYHRESGLRETVREGAIVLDAYGVASRLSYFLWGSMPDDALFAAAANGQLSTPDGIAAQAARMMEMPKFRDTLKSFHFQWLGIKDLATVAKDPNKFPEFTPELVAAMERETLDFVTDVVATDGKLKTMLTAQFSFLDADLAKIYGLPTTGLLPGQFQKVSLEGHNRSGVLTQPSFLAWGATTIDPLPPRRGLKVLEQFLCQLPPPPPDNVPALAPQGPNQTNRQRFEEHLKNGCAQACHGLIDPLGFAFEGFDAIGRFRTTDNNQPVNASGSLRLSPDGQEQFFNNAQEMNAILAQSPEVALCVAKKWFRFGLGRLERPGDGVGLKAAQQAFLSSDTDLRKLIAAIAVSRAFAERMPAEGEELP